ncbi:MAG TPA: hypothetical protein VF988_13390 [Verrucomicrobiae bacterium]
MKSTIPLVFAALALATGCASHHPKQNIAFSDEADVRAAISATASAPTQSQKQLGKTDQINIEQAVFAYLLQQQSREFTGYSALFFRADDVQVTALMKQFPHHNPPIKSGARASLRAHRAPRDKDTHKPAMILSVDVNEPNADGTVNATGRWYAGDAVSGFREFTLKPAEDAWQIVSVK